MGGGGRGRGEKGGDPHHGTQNKSRDRVAAKNHVGMTTANFSAYCQATRDGIKALSHSKKPINMLTKILPSSAFNCGNRTRE